MPNPTDPKAIDISPEAVGAAVEALGDSRSVNGYFSDATLHKFGDMIAALSATLSEARGKVGEAERERDDALFTLEEVNDALKEWLGPERGDDVLDNAKALVTDATGMLNSLQNGDAKHDEIKAERDAALSELAKLRKQIDDENERKGDDDTFW